MKILYAFDSFKNSLHSGELGNIAVKSSRGIDKNNIYRYVSIADGGEGSSDAIEPFINGEKIYLDTLDAEGLDIKSYYIIDKNTAYIEMAKTSGIENLNKRRTPILKRNSYGTGIVIKNAIERGIKNIVLFVGGTATCDGGTGIIDAIYDRSRENSLRNVYKFPEELRYKDVKIAIAVDVYNMLLGSMGASYVYAPQKGAKEKDVILLEQRMSKLRDQIFRKFGIDVNREGVGAGGGVIASLIPYFRTEIVSGFDFISSIVNLKKEISESDIIITGEGKVDNQSFMGKTVGNIVEITEGKGKIPVIICGYSEIEMKKYPIFTICRYKRAIFSKDEAINAFAETVILFVLWSKICRENC